MAVTHDRRRPDDAGPGDAAPASGQDRSQIPYTDDDSAAVAELAVAALVSIRCPAGGGALPTVSALASLAGEIDSRFYDVVADARDAGHSWDAIAERLALTARSARRRYGAYVAWRREGCPWPLPR